jgi:hypothetical protein
MAVAEPVLVGSSRMSTKQAQEDERDGGHRARARRREVHQPRARAPQVRLFAFGASMIICVFVTEWIVVMAPLTIRRFSWMTLTTGARQLVVHEAAVTTWSFAGS